MKIYIASSWKNQERVLALANMLEREGFTVDAFCRSTDQRVSFHWSEMVDTEEQLQTYDAISFLKDPRARRAFNEDKRWLDWADCVVMLMPCGRSSHLEGGYAKGKGKRLYLLGDFPKGEFDVMYGFADGIYQTEDINNLVNDLRKCIGTF